MDAFVSTLKGVRLEVLNPRNELWQQQHQPKQIHAAFQPKETERLRVEIALQFIIAVLQSG